MSFRSNNEFRICKCLKPVKRNKKILKDTFKVSKIL